MNRKREAITPDGERLLELALNGLETERASNGTAAMTVNFVNSVNFVLWQHVWGSGDQAYYLGKLSDFTSLERWKLMDLVNQVKTAIATLPKPANTPIGHYAPLDPKQGRRKDEK